VARHNYGFGPHYQRDGCSKFATENSTLGHRWTSSRLTHHGPGMEQLKETQAAARLCLPYAWLPGVGISAIRNLRNVKSVMLWDCEPASRKLQGRVDRHHLSVELMIDR